MRSGSLFFLQSGKYSSMFIYRLAKERMSFTLSSSIIGTEMTLILLDLICYIESNEIGKLTLLSPFGIAAK